MVSCGSAWVAVKVRQDGQSSSPPSYGSVWTSLSRRASAVRARVWRWSSRSRQAMEIHDGAGVRFSRSTHRRRQFLAASAAVGLAALDLPDAEAVTRRANRPGPTQR
ncbi:hypothetical protein OHA98_20530 [Streptomyces sp. NBC_00654]|uniref:hypothetical protein n=1 Tax=Streptomyces sp. NBC_00654 TaxID=2975799 RepID=UPI0022529580|nr:hypothetical protein [Streptomyces sp. NBC_00654]MCX4967132.1 hypothetical protein [Streptomyces sp. NBC_00654]